MEACVGTTVVIVDKEDRPNNLDTLSDDHVGVLRAVSETGLGKPKVSRPFLKRASGRGAAGTQTRVEQHPKEDVGLLTFLRGTGYDSRGRKLEDILGWDFDRMETVHDYIQWLFPTDEASRFNMGAPLLDSKLQHLIREEPALQASIRRNFTRFCSFLGLEVHLASTEPLSIRKASNFESRIADCWTGGCGGKGSNHNWLRISRVLRSLRLSGLDDEATSFMACLEALHAEGVECTSAMSHWRKNSLSL